MIIEISEANNHPDHRNGFDMHREFNYADWLLQSNLQWTKLQDLFIMHRQMGYVLECFLRAGVCIFRPPKALQWKSVVENSHSLPIVYILYQYTHYCTYLDYAFKMVTIIYSNHLYSQHQHTCQKYKLLWSLI